MMKTTATRMMPSITTIHEPAENCLTLPLTDDTTTCYLYGSVMDLPKAWDKLAKQSGDIFLQRAYLGVLENNPFKDMIPGYLIFFKDRKAVGIAILQYMAFRGGEQIRGEKKFSKVVECLRTGVASIANFNIVICGALQLTGQHAFYFTKSITSSNAAEILSDALASLQKNDHLAPRPVQASIIKDIPAERKSLVNNLESLRFNRLQFQPSMQMAVRPHWETMDDYLMDLSSKYRVRIRRALKKAKPLTWKRLEVEEIFAHSTRLHNLYCRLASSADFNMVWLPEGYIPGLAEALGEKFFVYAAFEEDKLVAFYSGILNNHDWDAHFLGYEESVNHRYQLYLNMLICHIRHGIEHRAERIVLSRTALTIKSSIGAVPVDYDLFLRTNRFAANRLVRPFARFMQPEMDFEQRHPFKKK